MSQPRVVLYSTSVPTLPKVRVGIATIKRILDAKKVEYEEVRAAIAVNQYTCHSEVSDSSLSLPGCLVAAV